MKLLHVCEVCGKREVLTPEEAFDLGWDYPPILGQYGKISPRTCGSCSIRDTAWTAIVSGAELTDKQLETVIRILAEPKSIIVEED